VSISEEIRASAAAHQHLGPGYDAAVAEGLVERIGEEIDRRVDARLGNQPLDSAPRRRPRRTPREHAAGEPPHLGFSQVVLALGSMGLAVGATAVVTNGTHAAPALAVLIWLVVGAVNIAYAWRR
jgi:hypothetical protein